MSDLVARLRSEDGDGDRDEPHLQRWWLRNPDGEEAADRIEALEAEVARLQARERELEAALREIRDQEWTENVLDPQWAARIATAALAAVSAETEDAS